jgi:hypothetical protein
MVSITVSLANAPAAGFPHAELELLRNGPISPDGPGRHLGTSRPTPVRPGRR